MPKTPRKQTSVKIDDLAADIEQSADSNLTTTTVWPSTMIRTLLRPASEAELSSRIHSGSVSYSPNTLGENSPAQVRAADGGFVSFAERIDARKIRARSESFFDHDSQASMFFRSQAAPEQNHIARALRFELGKVETPAIRERVVYHLAQIDKGLAKQVADGLGLAVPTETDGPPNMSIPADGDPGQYQSKHAKEMKPSPALSMANTVKGDITLTRLRC